MAGNQESLACIPTPIRSDGFNQAAKIPYGCTIGHIEQALNVFLDFLGFVNQQLHSRNMLRLESLLMPANFSSIVSEFMSSTIPQFCPALVKNGWHNGHPDLIPAGRFPNNAIQYAHDGIELKASRYLRGWQGHNAEESWLMVFVFDSNRPTDASKGIAPKSFRFVKVVGASLTTTDWKFSGRSDTSRRTITASVTPSGYEKMEANWIYRDLAFNPPPTEESGEDEDDEVTLA
jgi:hypothetical protein